MTRLHLSWWHQGFLHPPHMGHQWLIGFSLQICYIIILFNEPSRKAMNVPSGMPLSYSISTPLLLLLPLSSLFKSCDNHSNPASISKFNAMNHSMPATIPSPMPKTTTTQCIPPFWRLVTTTTRCMLPFPSPIPKATTWSLSFLTQCLQPLDVWSISKSNNYNHSMPAPFLKSNDYYPLMPASVSKSNDYNHSMPASMSKWMTWCMLSFSFLAQQLQPLDACFVSKFKDYIGLMPASVYKSNDFNHSMHASFSKFNCEDYCHWKHCQNKLSKK